MENKVKVGKIVNTHGIRGELKVAFSDQSFFEVGSTIYIKTKFDLEAHEIKQARLHKNHLLILIDELNNINDVLQYKTCDIYQDRDEEIQYMSDIIGYKVIWNDKQIGKVKEIIGSSMQEVIVLENNTMIPYVDEFVKNIDDENKTIKVDLIEGFIDEV